MPTSPHDERTALLDPRAIASGGLIRSGFHLPYDPKLIERARELRKNMAAAEKRLWYDCLRNFPYRVLRQRPIDHYIVDFYCPALHLVVERLWRIRAAGAVRWKRTASEAGNPIESG